MRIAIVATRFSPFVGGYESISLLCAKSFRDKGHSVTVVTDTVGSSDVDGHLMVHRALTRQSEIKVLRENDVVLMFNMSLRHFPQVVASRVPCVVSHQGFYKTPGKRFSSIERLKILATRFVTNIFASDSIRKHVGTKGTVIHNSYDDSTFVLRPEINRDRAVLFVGRLVSQKAADVVLHAVAEVNRRSGWDIQLRVCGDGPELSSLKKLAIQLGIRVDFLGVKQGTELSKVMNAHEIMVVPSRPTEGFGIVALEGIASGCFVIASDVGGLPEAVGNAGVVFPFDDITRLASIIQDRLLRPPKSDWIQVREHLSMHSADFVVDRYLDILLQLAGKAK